MISRCERFTDKDYSKYGGRGIKVCEPWTDYKNFIKDMGERPDNLSLDRINVDGNYEKTNCRWASSSQQQKNKTSTRFYYSPSYMFTGTLVEIAAFLGVSKENAFYRWKKWKTFCRGTLWQELPKA